MTQPLQTYGTVAAAGSSSSDATLLTYHVNYVTGADGTKGVKLPLLNALIDEIHVFNGSGTVKPLFIYPSTGNDLIMEAPHIAALHGQWCTFRRVDINSWVFANSPNFPFFLAVSPAGTTQGTATLLTMGTNLHQALPTAGNEGIRLRSNTGSEGKIASDIQYLHNRSASVTLNLYPATGEGINNLAVNTAFAIPATKCAIILYVENSNWIVGYLN